jgi:hypothetical protein
MRIVIPNALTLPAIPPGAYKARISGYKYKTSNQGNPMMQLELTLLSQGPNAEVKTINRKVVDMIPITEETIWRANMVFKACTGTDLVAGTEYTVEDLINYIAGNIMNKEVVINVDVEQYQGQMRNRVKGYNPVVV